MPESFSRPAAGPRDVYRPSTSGTGASSSRQPFQKCANSSAERIGSPRSNTAPFPTMCSSMARRAAPPHARSASGEPAPAMPSVLPSAAVPRTTVSTSAVGALQKSDLVAAPKPPGVFGAVPPPLPLPLSLVFEALDLTGEDLARVVAVAEPGGVRAHFSNQPSSKGTRLGNFLSSSLLNTNFGEPAIVAACTFGDIEGASSGSSASSARSKLTSIVFMFSK